MAIRKRVALIGDFNPEVIAHRAIPVALALAGNGEVEPCWVATREAGNLRDFDGVWCVPASPYKSMDGALNAIRWARESGTPFLGTCGGFQHAVIEYARNVLNLSAADHAEINPQGPLSIIAPLACALVEQTGEIELQPDTLIANAYGRRKIKEEYHCSYGLNPAFSSQIFGGALVATAHDASGEVRALELRGHPFFAATLFQPERRALHGEIPPLVSLFVEKLRAQKP